MKQFLISTAACIAFAQATVAGAVTFYDNLSGGPAFGVPARTISAGGTVAFNDPAYGFTALTSGALNQIDLGLRFDPGASFNLTLTTSAFNAAVLGTGQAPATVLGSWTLAHTGFSGFAVRSVTGISGINLIQGTAYWLHATPVAGVTLWSTNTSGAMGPLYQCNGSPCATHISFASTDSGVMRLTGVAAAIPEPATWALMIGGFGAAGSALRRRSRPVVIA